LPHPARAQAWDVTAYGLASTNAEVDRTRQARGFGIGADLGVELRHFRLDVSAQTASLHADFDIQPDYAVNELALLGTYRWRPALAFQLGAARRFTSPDFVAQELGLIRIGVLTQTALSSIGWANARAAYLPLTKFSGGGSGGLALELGLGVGVGPANGRFAGVLDYTYQRIDRKVNGVDAPIRYSVTHAGLRMRW
jgi:hypothetical protein